MKQATLFLIVLLGQEAKPGLSGPEMAQAKAILKKVFAAESPDALRAALAELEPLDRPSKADLAALQKECFRLAFQGPRQEGKSPVKCTHPGFPGTYILHVPSAARKGARVGVFIGLHGGGPGVGDGAQIESLFGTPNSQFITVYPTVIQKDNGAWNTEREEQYVLAILGELKRTYNVDTNRVYLAGHSMGGFGTWSIAGRHADVFAAASAMAGGTYGPGVLPNYKNLPVWFYHSTDDPQVDFKSDRLASETLDRLRKEHGPYDFVYKEYGDIGHGLPKEGLKPVWDWVFAKKRDPFPKHVVWEPTRPYKRHFYWVKSEGGGAVDVKLEGQKIVLKGSGVTLFLNEKMVKFSEEVTVVDPTGKELWKSKPSLSLVALVESIAVKRDLESIFTARIKP